MNYPLRIRQVSPASSLENFHFYKMEWFTEVNNLNIKEEAKKEILKVFQTYDQVGIAFSGGKDSTVLLDLVLKILREKKEKELFVIHNDTLVENPNEEEGFTDFKKVYKLYKDANGECPILFDPKLSNVPKKGCGARFGCWVCSLVKEDKSTKNLLSHYSWLEPYFRFREWMISFCEKTENRTGRRRNGKILGEGRGQLTLKAREEILKKLKNLEREVGKELLSNEKFLFITNSWGEELKRKT